MDYTIIAFDIEGYSNSGSSDEMKEKRQILEEILRESARNVHFQRFDNAQLTYTDTGDGAFVSVDTRDYETPSEISR